jgi:hypothetical protein
VPHAVDSRQDLPLPCVDGWGSIFDHEVAREHFQITHGLRVSRPTTRFRIALLLFVLLTTTKIRY